MISYFLLGFLKLKDLSKATIPDCVRKHDNDWPCELQFIFSHPDSLRQVLSTPHATGEVVGVSNQESWTEDTEVKSPIKHFFVVLFSST